MLEHRGHAMGTKVHVVLVGGTPDLMDTLTGRLAELEARWSRFVGSSEISALNAEPDRWHLVSPETALLVARGRTGWELTRGAFDPTVLDAVEALGYRERFDGLRRATIEAEPAAPTAGCSELDVHLDTCLVHLGSGTRFDPGGIGKGLAGDLVVEEAMAAGASGAMVNIGGDLACGGTGPDDGPWAVEVRTPHRGDGPATTIALTHGGVATSTTCKRRWATTDGKERHHLVDPRSGRNTSGVASVTVIAAHGWWAEVVAKQVVVDGVDAEVDVDRAAALVIDDRGDRHDIGDFQRYVR